MTMELKLVVDGHLLPSDKFSRVAKNDLLEDFLKFAGTAHNKRISWAALGYDPDVDMVSAKQRLEWDSKIPPHKLPPPGPTTEKAYRASIREALYRAISEHRDY